MADLNLEWCAEELTDVVLYALYDGGLMQANRLGENWAISVGLRLNSEDSGTGGFKLSITAGELVPELSEIHKGFTICDESSSAEARSGDISIGVAGDAGNGKGELTMATALLGIVWAAVDDFCVRFHAAVELTANTSLLGDMCRDGGVKIWQRYKTKVMANQFDRQTLARAQMSMISE